MTTSHRTATDLLAAAERIIDHHGPDGVTMRAVGAQAGVSAMALYRHYPNRDTLLTAVADRALESMARRLVVIAGARTRSRSPSPHPASSR